MFWRGCWRRTSWQVARTSERYFENLILLDREQQQVKQVFKPVSHGKECQHGEFQVLQKSVKCDLEVSCFMSGPQVLKAQCGHQLLEETTIRNQDNH